MDRGFNNFSNPASVQGGRPFGGYQMPQSNPSITHSGVGGSHVPVIKDYNNMNKELQESLENAARIEEELNRQNSNVNLQPQQIYGHHFDLIPPKAQDIIRSQSHEPYNNPCLSAAPHMVYTTFKEYRDYEMNFEHRYDHPNGYSYTYDFSNFPNLSGIPECGMYVAHHMAHWINVKSASAGNNVLADTKIIKLNHNNLNDGWTKPLFDSFYHQKFNLTLLDLSHNTSISDGCVEQLLYVMKKESGKQEHNITSLILHHNNITDNGAGKISDALKNGDLDKTKVIDVSGNKITPIGCGYFINAMEVRQSDKPLLVTIYQDIKPVVEFLKKGFKYAVEQHSNQPHSYKEFHKVVSNKTTEEWRFCKKAGWNINMAFSAGVFKCSHLKDKKVVAFCALLDSADAIINPDNLACIAEINKAIDDIDLIGNDCNIF